MDKCGFCVGRGLHDSYSNHTLRACKQSGAAQLKVRLGGVIHLEGYKARGSCGDCGIPREFCQRWEKGKDESWEVNELKKCQYEQLVYDIVIGLFQCSDSRYSMDLYTTIQEEGNERYAHLSDEDVAAWLCKDMIVAGVKCSEIIWQFWIWTIMIQKRKTVFS